MALKKYLNDVIEQKRNQIAKVESALVESDNKEERQELGETLKALKKELEEAEKALKEAGDSTGEGGTGTGEGEGGTGDGKGEGRSGDQGDGNAREMRMKVLGTYAQRGTTTGTLESYNKELEKRGAALKEKRAITVPTGVALLPTHEGTVLNDTFRPVSTLVDIVSSENLNGGESYKEAYVKSYGEGGITKEGEDYTEAEPEFGYAPMNKVKITAYAEISEEVKKLPNIDYAAKVQEACLIALKKKLSSQIMNGTGTDQLFGVFGTPVAIDSGKDVEIAVVDDKTLNAAIFNYGGDEDVESEGALILNKGTLKALSEVTKANGDPFYKIDVKNKTIDTIPYIINSNVKDFTTAAAGDFVAAYGNVRSYKVVTFSPVEIIESEHFKFKQGQICFKASVFVGGNVVMQDGLLRIKKKNAE